jgi:hypothetical protein
MATATKVYDIANELKRCTIDCLVLENNFRPVATVLISESGIPSRGVPPLPKLSMAKRSPSELMKQ